MWLEGFPCCEHVVFMYEKTQATIRNFLLGEGYENSPAYSMTFILIIRGASASQGRGGRQ